MRTLSKEELYKIYPSSDGKRMADNTLQWEWIALIKLGMDAVFKDRPDVFVAGDLLWYPVKGRIDIRVAPDVLIAIGAPKEMRGSYIQFAENNLPPQVVVEILSPSNTAKEMEKKLAFYQTYGVEEYYIYDPIRFTFKVYARQNDLLEQQQIVDEWMSPILGVRWSMKNGILELYRPDGQPFLSYLELLEEQNAAIEELQEQREAMKKTLQQLAEQERMILAQAKSIEQERKKLKVEKLRADVEWKRAEEESLRAEQEKQRAEQEKQRAEQEKQRAEQEKQRAEQEKQRADEEKAAKEKLIQKLKELGIDPHSI